MTSGAASMTIPRRVGIVVGFLALAAVPALGLSAFAAADTGTGAASDQPGTRPPHPVLTDAQRQCLADNGVTLPERPTSGDPGQRLTPPTAEQRAAREAAAQACGLPTPPMGDHRPGGFGFGPRPLLTDAQKQCLADQGVALPERPATGAGQPPAPPTAEQRAALQQAATACGITIPGPRVTGAGQNAAV
jgi:hypothetical protein